MKTIKVVHRRHRRHDIRHDGTRHNDAQHILARCNTRFGMPKLSIQCRNSERHIFIATMSVVMLSVITLGVIVLSIIMLGAIVLGIIMQ